MENQEKLVVFIKFQKVQKERKDDQDKMFSFNRPNRRYILAVVGKTQQQQKVKQGQRVKTT